MVEDAISFWTEIQRYEDRLAADPRSLCFVELSELYRKLGLLDDAVSVAKKGSDLHPDHAAGLYVLGTSCHAKGLEREAREALERTVELEPGHLDAARLLSQLYVAAGELARAGKLLREIMRQHPDDVETGLLLRSIGGEDESAAAEEEQPEELEEVEVIEELTEVLDEPQEEPASFVSGRGAQGGSGEPVAAGPVPAPAGREVDPFAIFADESPLWDVEAPGELQPSELSGNFDLSGRGQADKELRSHSASDEPDHWSELFASPPAAEPTAAQHPARDPLTTATLAELYVTQGFIDKALGIYRELQASDPANPAYRSRCAELAELKKQAGPQAAQAQQPPAVATAAQRQAGPAVPPASEPPASRAAAGAAFESELCHWLENIRRRRDGV